VASSAADSARPVGSATLVLLEDASECSLDPMLELSAALSSAGAALRRENGHMLAMREVRIVANRDYSLHVSTGHNMRLALINGMFHGAVLPARV
jgi:hypothetical protein